MEVTPEEGVSREKKQAHCSLGGAEAADSLGGARQRGVLHETCFHFGLFPEVERDHAGVRAGRFHDGSHTESLI